MRRRDKQELTMERLRRAFPMFNSRRALQRKCKREDAILVTIIIFFFMRNMCRSIIARRNYR